MVTGLNNLHDCLTTILVKYDINEEIVLTYSQHKDFDVQCNNLVKYSKNQNINNIKKEILDSVAKINHIKNCEFSDNLFINFELDETYFEQTLLSMPLPKRNESILFDYGGPNIGKALHVGHLRTLNIGRALYNINKFVGNKVISDIHLGDWGMPVALIIAYIENQNLDIKTILANELEHIYPESNKMASTNIEFYETAKNISTKLNNKDPEYIEKWKIIYNLSVDEIKNTLGRLNHEFDYFYGESDVVEESSKVLEIAKNKKLTNENQGAIVSSEDVDPPIILVKSDGSYLYLTTDLGTVLFREQNFDIDKYLYVVDQRQSNHFSQVFSTVKHFNLSSKEFLHISYGTVNGKDGKPLKTRDGGTYKLEDLYSDTYNFLEKNNDDTKTLECLTNSVLTYSDLLPNRKINYQFDIEKFTDINGKTAIYLQYAQVRAKKLMEEGTDIKQVKNISELNNNERDLAFLITKFPYFLLISLDRHEPHHLAEYAYDLSKSFNTFYTNNKIFSSNVLPNDKEKRLFLVRKFYKVINDVFFCLGITPVDEM